jgi:UDP-glucose 4-epimerase
MKKIIVTGGAGYIGSICVEQMINQGFEVSVFDNLTEGHAKAIDPRADFYQGDLADRSVLRHVFEEVKPDAVMHFAANALVGESMTNPSKYFRNNVSSGINLLDMVVEFGVKKFVFSSTCATFGIPDRMPLDESLPQKPINPYGESKLMFETILRWYHEIHKISFTALRYFNAAGASEAFGEDHRIETHLIPNVLKVALGQKDQVDIYGTDYPTPDGTCIRDYIHIADLAQAHIQALAPGKHGFFNLGNGSGFSVREVIESCRRISGRPIAVVEKDRRPGDPPRLVAAAQKAATELGWHPRFPHLDQIVQTAWD